MDDNQSEKEHGNARVKFKTIKKNNKEDIDKNSDPQSATKAQINKVLELL